MTTRTHRSRSPIALLLGLGLTASACGLSVGTGTPAASPQPALDPTVAPSTTTSSVTSGPSQLPSTTTTAPPETTITTVAVQDPAVATLLAADAEYVDEPVTYTDDRELEAQSWTETDDDGARSTVACEPGVFGTVTRTLRELQAFGLSGDPVVPGSIIAGSVVDDGAVRVIPLERAPMTLRSDRASATPIVDVESPDSGSLTTAVAELKRDADARLGAGGVDLAGADIEYRRTETHSFEHTSLELGLSLRYRSPMVRAGMDAAYAQSEEVTRHTISVRMVQRVITIDALDDRVGDPGDYFAAEVTAAEVSSLSDRGVITPDRPPMLIDRVTYGRMMVFTLSSTEVDSARELEVAIDAARGQLSGEAELTAEQRSTLANSSVSLIAYGGDQDLALGAIRSGDLNRFFGATNTANAEPLSFALRTLDGGVVELGESAEVQQLTCTTRAADPIRYSIQVRDVQGRIKITIGNVERLRVDDENPVIGRKVDGEGRLTKNQMDDFLVVGENRITIRYTNLGCDNRFTVVLNEEGAGGETIVQHPDPGQCFGEGDLFRYYIIDTAVGEVRETDKNWNDLSS